MTEYGKTTDSREMADNRSGSDGGRVPEDRSGSDRGRLPEDRSGSDRERLPDDSGALDGGRVPDDSTAPNGRILTTENIKDYLEWLLEEERETNTIEKYGRDLNHLYQWVDGRPLTKLLVKEWKTGLQPRYQPSSINSMLAAVNGFFHWMGWYELEMKYLKIQKKIFCDQNKELTRAEYDKLVAVALALGKIRLAFLLETLCGMGLRVSELQFITVEAVKKGRADIAMKGKIRTVIRPEESKKGRRKQGCRKFNNRQSVSLCPFLITNLNSSPLSAPNLLKKEQKIEKDKIWHLHSRR